MIVMVPSLKRHPGFVARVMNDKNILDGMAEGEDQS